MSTHAEAIFHRISQKYLVDGKPSPITDAQDRELFNLAWMLMTATATLQGIADGKFKSTDALTVYAGGIISPGNRIYTPAEGAQHALDDLAELDKVTVI